MFFSSHQRTSASSRPWVTQTSLGPISSMVDSNSGQSQWSEMTSGSSTPPCLARWRTIIQPEAKAISGSLKRRAQRSWKAEGGPTMTAPLNVSGLLFSIVAGLISPRSIPCPT